MIAHLCRLIADYHAHPARTQISVQVHIYEFVLFGTQTAQAVDNAHLIPDFSICLLNMIQLDDEFLWYDLERNSTESRLPEAGELVQELVEEYTTARDLLDSDWPVTHNLTQLCVKRAFLCL